MSVVVITICGVMLSIGAVLALIRVVRGPSILDRAVGVDILVSTVFGAVALHAGWLQETFTLPVLVVLATVGFIGSVSVARFAATDAQQPEEGDNLNIQLDDDNRRITGNPPDSDWNSTAKYSEGDRT